MAGRIAPQAKGLGSSPETSLAARLGGPVAGMDEVGRGPWAGPVLVAAVLLPAGPPLPGLADSKRLGAARRRALCNLLRESAAIGIGLASPAEIDTLNILRATDLAMRRALGALLAQTPLAGVLIDGNRVPPDLPLRGEALVRGDGLSASIAAASIVAKVTRDALMADLARRHPGYGWERNAGYGTVEHRAALQRLGVTPEHRRSFRPIHHILYEESGINS